MWLVEGDIGETGSWETIENGVGEGGRKKRERRVKGETNETSLCVSSEVEAKCDSLEVGSVGPMRSECQERTLYECSRSHRTDGYCHNIERLLICQINLGMYWDRTEGISGVKGCNGRVWGMLPVPFNATHRGRWRSRPQFSWHWQVAFSPCG